MPSWREGLGHQRVRHHRQGGADHRHAGAAAVRRRRPRDRSRPAGGGSATSGSPPSHWSASAAAVTRPDGDWVDALPTLRGPAAAAWTLRWLLGIAAPAGEATGVAAAPPDGRRPPAVPAGRRGHRLGGGDRRRPGYWPCAGGSRSMQARAVARAAHAHLARRRRARGQRGRGRRAWGPTSRPNGSFYRIDTALVVPQVSPSGLAAAGPRHGGPGAHAHLRRPAGPTRWSSASSPWPACRTRSGDDLIGNARWLGVPLADVLAEAGVHEGADAAGEPVVRRVDVRHADGRRARRARRAAGRRHERGAAAGVARLPGPDGGAGAVRVRLGDQVGDRAGALDLRRLRRLLGPAGLGRRGPDQDDEPHRHAPKWRWPRGPGPWRSRGWPGPSTAASPRSRSRSTRPPGRRPAWPTSPRSTPGGSGPSTGRPRPARHRLRVRATDADGYVQTEEEADVVPDGATGWHTVFVDVAGA